MSFAVIQTGGKQYKVSANEILRIERLKDQEGKIIEFKNVLFLNDDKTTEFGNPNIQGAKVEAKILKNKKNKTILVFKKKRRKNSRKKYGHRQPISIIKITKIFSKNGKLIAQADLKKEKIPSKVERTKSQPISEIEVEDIKKLQGKETKKIIKTKKFDSEKSRISKAEDTRILQAEEAKKMDKEEKLILKKAQERIKLKDKKVNVVKKKILDKNKKSITKKK